MTAPELKQLQKFLQDVKRHYLAARGRGGLGREEPDGVTAEVEATEFLDEELEEAFRVYARKQIAETLGIESWVKPEHAE